MRILRFMLGPALLVAAVLFAGATVVHADDCQKRTAKADHKLHEAIEHHGSQSSQAEHWRHELAEARSYCWEHGHRWWEIDVTYLAIVALEKIGLAWKVVRGRGK
jgi:hypothetical protein